MPEPLNTPLSTPLNKNKPLSVSNFLSQVQDLMDQGFTAELQIKGELSSFKAYPSGHWYFTIKDKDSQLQCTMFRNQTVGVLQKPQEGDALVVSGSPNIYKARGQMNFIVSSIVKEGVGDILLEFEKTKQKLQEEGLFDDSQKQPIPSLIRNLCIITSSQTAALQDVIKVISRRMPMMRLYLAPSMVQGEKSAKKLVEMVNFANSYHASGKGSFDAILITRGGGSPEDLHCFNDEGLARAISASELPVVSAVGHEVDFTICDLVADYRAPTPSAAAEELSIDSVELISQLDDTRQRLHSTLIHRTNNSRQLVDDFWHRILRSNPVADSLREIGELTRGLRHGIYMHLAQIKDILADYAATLQPHNPRDKYRSSYSDLKEYRHALNHSIRALLSKHNDNLVFSSRQAELGIERQLASYKSLPSHYAKVLEALNPTAILTRGYALIAKENGELIRDAKQLKKGDMIKLRLSRGSGSAEIKDITTESPTNNSAETTRNGKNAGNNANNDKLL